MTLRITSSSGNICSRLSSGAPQDGTVPGGCAWIHTWRPATQAAAPATRKIKTP